MASGELDALTPQEAIKKLFGKQTLPDGSPPPLSEWKRNTHATLGIDRIIKVLIDQRTNKNAKIAIRDPEYFESRRPGFCPFYAVRIDMILAVSTAGTIMERTKQAESVSKHLADLEKIAKATLKQSSLFRQYYSPSSFQFDMSFDGSTIDLDERDALTKKHFAVFSELHNLGKRYSELVDFVRDSAKQERDRLNQKRRNEIWRQIFVEEMGYGWRALTGANPAGLGPFLDFVNAAYYDLGGKTSLAGIIRTVLVSVAQRPADDRFDRNYVKQEKMIIQKVGARYKRSRPSNKAAND
jgi:hypothetical protein